MLLRSMLILLMILVAPTVSNAITTDHLMRVVVAALLALVALTAITLTDSIIEKRRRQSE